MVWVSYCKTCKEVIAWGDKKEAVSSLKHMLTDQFTEVVLKDEEGNDVTVGESKTPLKVRKNVEHECGVFEISELPEAEYDKSLDDKKSELDSKLASDIISMDEFIKEATAINRLKEASKIGERKAIIEELYADKMNDDGVDQEKDLKG